MLLGRRGLPGQPLQRWWTCGKLHSLTRKLYAGRMACSAPAVQVVSAGLQDKDVVNGGMDVYAISDLHTDHEENLAWVKRLPRGRHGNDVLIVAGDVSDDMRIFRETMAELVDRFGHVAFVPGNHELWVRGIDGDYEQRNEGARDSLEKLHRVLNICTEMGVSVKPCKVGNFWLVPILSWHHRSFDTEPDIPGIPPASPMTISDYRHCKWSLCSHENGSEAIAEYIDALNDGSWVESVDSSSNDVISFSHFLPHIELLPEKRFLYYPNIAKVVGSDPLKRRIQKLRPHLHIFGHTHFGWDAVVDGVRYVQCALGYPKERQKRYPSMLLSQNPRELMETPPESSRVKNPTFLPALVYTSTSCQQAETPPLPTSESGDAGDGSPQAKASEGTVPNGFGREDESRDGAVSVYPAAKGRMQPLHSKWSDYYQSNPRTPENLTLAPWAASRYQQSKRKA
ncbi:unnamed protein product [Ostreobium quekettii]|uniref:Calcineurin-like phosphoesterase domain-containing protein n=1 Tax=Ostreobium quekettii TaxID=121088 RepID=A0A8S1INX4_9CHLO|nr:unnamed protein product [Ostreobium quekettii]|eukprot:evm.model.scf_126.5 EVM.evm.TU.scf_126.5   scf_126:99310-104235(+)